MNINGYNASWCPNHPRTIGNSGCVYDHILVAEKMLGRSLTAEEVVHHIDEDRANNNFSNLIVFKTKGDHTRYHKTGKIQKENDYYISPQNTCCDCGRIISNRNKRCDTCNRIFQRKVEDRPSRKELKNLIRHNSFVALGKQFGISDNGVRRWCKIYNLPFRTTDIKKYSDQEWKSI